MFKSFALLVVFASTSALAQGVTPFCSLQCANGGECKRTGERTNISKGADAKKANNRLPDDSHCSCPTGYTGVLCEIKYTMCEGDVKTCFNGEDCIRNIDDRGKSFYHCQCDAVESDLSTPEAHKFCQHIFTSFCTDKAANIDKYSSFCTNFGVCKDKKGKSKYHAGCDCPEGWAGHHCEIAENALTEFQKRGHHHSPFMVFIVFLIAIMVGIIGLFVQHGFHDNRRSFGRGRRGRGRGYPAEQDFNVGSIEFTQAPVEDNDDDESL